MCSVRAHRHVGGRRPVGHERGQLHHRLVFTTLGVRAHNQPEVCVSFAGDKVDESGILTDEPTREQVRLPLERLVT